MNQQAFRQRETALLVIFEVREMLKAKVRSDAPDHGGRNTKWKEAATDVSRPTVELHRKVFSIWNPQRILMQQG